MRISPSAGKILDSSELVNLPRLLTRYYSEVPDPRVEGQRVAFGTSGHRGNSYDVSFNEGHILAITQAICEYRAANDITGPLFLGMDTHALSEPALVTALEVLAGNRVHVMLACNDEYTPTPAVSHAILAYNQEPKAGLADGIVISPSHNPPQDGGFKYNPPHGGPAETKITGPIQKRANEILAEGLDKVRRMTYANALKAPTTHRHDFLNAYVADLGDVIDMEVIRGSQIKLGVDPLGGAGVRYWEPIAERYGLNLTVVNKIIDPTFRFMTADWDGQIRMDPSSVYAMHSLIALKDRFQVAFACDTDHDRHGIVTASSGLMPPNHYLAAAAYYLFTHRPDWNSQAAVGKTLVSSQIIDRVAAKLGRKLYEVPVGFKWFVEGLTKGALNFVGEESAGATLARRDGSVWTTDKDGIVMALLAAEITARTEKDPGQIYDDLTAELGKPIADRVEAPANAEQKKALEELTRDQIHQSDLAGEKIIDILDRAPGNDAKIGGLKVTTESGWFAARPSGTEAIYKIYAESFRDQSHLRQILKEAQVIVDQAIGVKPEL